MLSVLLNVLLKVCQAYEQPAFHGPILAGPQGSLLLSVVHPSLSLIRRLLSHLIRCRDSDFQDLTAVPVLLQTWALVGAVPASSMHFNKVADCCDEIIATLLAFSQPSVQANGCVGNNISGTVGSGGTKTASTTSTPEDALSRSLWTQMVREILKYIHHCSGPAAFITGLQVLNQLLPLPLPLNRRVTGFPAPKTTNPWSEEDSQEMINSRKLWSVHLHTLGPQIQQVVRLLCCSGPQLLQLLRKVCVQIADLSATTALVIARAALDAILTSCLVVQQQQQQIPSPPPVPPSTPGLGTVKVELTDIEKDPSTSTALPATLICSAHSARVLNFLAAIVPHAPVKAAVLQLCRAGLKSDEKYSDFLPCLCLILNSDSAAPPHIQSQECVVSIFASLLDADICMLPPLDKTESASVNCGYEAYLSAALPSREALSQIVTGLWDHLANTEHNYSSLLPTLRTLTLLTEHNYTFQQLQRVLERPSQPDQEPPLRVFFSKMATGFSKDSSDYLSTLSTALELLLILVKAQPERGILLHSTRPVRSLTLTISQLSVILRWSEASGSINSASKHPLLILQDLLREHSTEESMESLRSSLGTLIEILHSAEQQPCPSLSAKEAAEIIIPPPEPLNLQFSQRPLLTELPADEDRLTSAFWLTQQHSWMEEADPETEQIRCDLLEVVSSCLPNIDLMKETERVCKILTDPKGSEGNPSVENNKSSSSSEFNKPGSAGGRVFISTARDGSGHLGSVAGKSYVAPMRGRGFGRPGGGINNRNDPFRSRAPNTSRPPSLHVDDFVALEKNNGTASGNASSSLGVGPYGSKTARGRGGNNGNGNSGSNRGGRGGFTANTNTGRFNHFQAPRREAVGNTRVGVRPGNTSSSSSVPPSGGNDPYGTSTRFNPSGSNRIWTGTTGNTGGSSRGGSKERYPSPSSNASSSSAGRPRNTRTFSR